MSATKRFLEKVSQDMGYDGEINDDVTMEAARRARELSRPYMGDKVVWIDGWIEGRVEEVLMSGVCKLIMSDNTNKIGRLGTDFMLQKSLDFHAQMEAVDE